MTIYICGSESKVAHTNSGCHTLHRSNRYSPIRTETVVKPEFNDPVVCVVVGRRIRRLRLCQACRRRDRYEAIRTLIR